MSAYGREHEEGHGVKVWCVRKLPGKTPVTLTKHVVLATLRVVEDPTPDEQRIPDQPIHGALS